MVGKVTTQGDQILKADIARQLFGLDGKGIKVGIISDSFNSLSGLSENVKSGDLPGKANPFGYQQPVTILADTDEPLLDEGRALGQIVHDIAPGAELFFHTFVEENQDGLFADEETFAKAVSTLVAAGVDIIVEDAIVPASLLQDGKAAKAIEAAIDQGVVVVSSAGNNGGISYESVFRPGAEFELEGFQFQAHDFDSTDGVDFFQNINLPEGNTIISPLLGWDDPIGEIKTEYVQFLVNTPELPNLDNIVGISGVISESAVDVPLQGLRYAPENGEQLYFVVAKVGDDISEKPTFIKWVSNANGADRTIDYEYIDEDANNRSVYGHSNAPRSITVGATNIENPTEIRDYSSQGGSPILLDSGGNRLANPILRNKPEIYAPDGVATNFPIDSSFAEFFGTSASAPHIAGIVALMLDRADGNLTPEEIRTKVQNTALSIKEGSGLVQADRAVIESFVSEKIGSDCTDFINGTDSADNLYGNKGADILIGRGGQDYLVGGEGKDILLGGKGNDVLDGGKGNDILIGEKGADRFVLRSLYGQDKILDYHPGEDFFILEDLTFEKLTITQGSFSTSIQVTNTQEKLAELIGIQASTIGVENFIALA
ncbi:S8 family serine peptidase [Nostocaceae cyanobacterium CENA357]|uniref:S8 family serine peptidase n=1 Tax=Atlanticothrix silvestris CENA357 TaxID=1725252 RepID=A0A8J7HGX9_9CYAN|nr:S8 family serine peptidase [Atlanticothrix silvestris]MBH8554939.1 S8 family serine peptidase [Atlanticothrix silvestris CENA357]